MKVLKRRGVGFWCEAIAKESKLLVPFMMGVNDCRAMLRSTGHAVGLNHGCLFGLFENCGPAAEYFWEEDNDPDTLLLYELIRSAGGLVPGTCQSTQSERPCDKVTIGTVNALFIAMRLSRNPDIPTRARCSEREGTVES